MRENPFKPPNAPERRRPLGPDFATASMMQLALRAVGTVSMAVGLVLVLFAGAVATGLVGIPTEDLDSSQSMSVLVAAPYLLLGLLAVLVGWLTRRLGVSKR